MTSNVPGKWAIYLTLSTFDYNKGMNFDRSVIELPRKEFLSLKTAGLIVGVLHPMILAANEVIRTGTDIR